MVSLDSTAAFPSLSEDELDLLRTLARRQDYADGEPLFEAGDSRLDLLIVERGEIEIRNPLDHGQIVAVHGPGEFAGDIDLLTGRPVLFEGLAHGPTRVLRLPFRSLRSLLNRMPSFGEKLMTALTQRRELLDSAGIVGLQVFGPGHCAETNVVREFLYKNFVPFTWFDPETESGHAAWEAAGGGRPWPMVICGDGRQLLDPSLRELAECAGVWGECPTEPIDLAIVGAGPAGLTAGVYAASEGLSTLLLDRMGPGGQAGGSSRIENFIGFPAGLSGADLAMRGTLQMLKFGGRLIAPVEVTELIASRQPGEPHELRLDCGARVRAQVVLIAAGVCWRRLEAPGAERFTGAGVHYVCTRCEADLYQGLDVAVIGAGNSAGQAVMFLSECCPQRTVHLLVRRQLGPGMSEYLANRVRAAANVSIHEQTETRAVNGGREIESIEVEHGPDSIREVLPVSAVFVFIGAEPNAPWVPDEIARDEKGYLLTGTETLQSGRWPLKNRAPTALETTLPGILAAGDFRAGSTKRVGFAVGDGSLAVTCAHQLLEHRRSGSI